MERVSVRTKALEIGLRVLNAYTSQTLPAAADEAYLRKLTGDRTTPGAELACQIIQAELRKMRLKSCSAAKATSTNGTNTDSRLLDELTPRETEVLVLIAEGLSTKRIGQQLGISFKTAVCHRSRIMGKLDIHETASLVRYAIRRGIIKA